MAEETFCRGRGALNLQAGLRYDRAIARGRGYRQVFGHGRIGCACRGGPRATLDMGRLRRKTSSSMCVGRFDGPHQGASESRGATKATWIRALYRRAWDSTSTAVSRISDSMSDYPMLAVVGKPAVINPDKPF